eukprot:m.270141 g.270141  ORF g.270141 m.270141 type:complete len:1003 (-) comp88300_c0_seq1:409-3417(-)
MSKPNSLNSQAFGKKRVGTPPADAEVSKKLKICSENAAENTADEMEDDALNSCLTPIRLNKHPEIAQQLGGELAVGRALTELLTNAYDAATDPNLVSIVVRGRDDGDRDAHVIPLSDLRSSGDTEVSLEIMIKNDGRLMDFTAFREKPNNVKQKDVKMTGKFGVGLKDAMAQLYYYNLSYAARTKDRTVNLLPELCLGGVVGVQQVLDSNNVIGTEVTVTWERATAPQALRFKTFECAKSLCNQLADALDYCWPWLVCAGNLKVVFEHESGQIARWVDPEVCLNNRVFVHNKRYDTGGTNYHGFALAYNLFPEKKVIVERERLRPYVEWSKDGIKLFMSSKKDMGSKLFADFAKSVNTMFGNHPKCWELTNDIGEQVLISVAEAVKVQREEAENFQRREMAVKAASMKLDEAKDEAKDEADEDDMPLDTLSVQAAKEVYQRAVTELGAVQPVTFPPRMVIRELPRERKTNVVSETEAPEDVYVINKSATRVLRTKRGQKVLEHVSLDTDSVTDTSSDRRLRRSLARVCDSLCEVLKSDHVYVNIVSADQTTTPWARWDAHARCFDIKSAEEDVESRVVACLDALNRDFVQFTTVMAKALLSNSLKKHLTVDPPPPQIGKETPPIFRPMLVIDDWGSATGGIAAFNFQLALELARLENTEVYVLITVNAAMPPIDARPEGIVFVRLEDGQPDMFRERAKTITTLIGHGHRVAGKEFLRISKHVDFTHCIKWMFLHTTPERIEVVKGTEEKAAMKEKELIDMANQCDKVFPVGTYMFEYWEPKLEVEVLEFTPQLNSEFVKCASPAKSSNSTFTMCCIGRVSGVLHSKGLDILASLVQCLLGEPAVRPHLNIRGIKEQSFEDARLDLNISKDNVNVSVLGFGTHSHVQQDLKKAHLFLMPSIVEPFGLSGLEALASGVVPLMSSESGLAMHIKKHCVDNPNSGCTDAQRLIVEHVSNAEDRLRSWCERVQEMRDDRASLPELAQRIVSCLGNLPNSAQWLRDQW